MSKSTIEWTERTWNPTTGCTIYSAGGGCDNCYAARLSKRLQAMGLKKYRNGFELTLHPDALMDPYEWKQPQLVFVNSMSDLFHKDVPTAFIKQVFKVMNENPQHVFQVLTKRSRRLAELQQELDWTPNIWAGVSVESLTVAKRVDDLRKVGARVRFLSCEPLLGPLAGLDLTDIQWVICGGESGPGARPMLKEWVEDLQLACQQMRIPFFFKQWGGFSKKKTGFHLNGMAYREMPIY